MSKKKNAKPMRKLQWKAECLLYLGFERALSLCSLPTVYLLGEFMGSLAYRLTPRYRAIVRRNLTVVTGNLECHNRVTEDMIEDVFRKNGGNLLTSISAGILSSEQVAQHISFEGREEFVESLHDQGAIIVLAHMGNWEILTKFADFLPNRNAVGALYRPLNNPYFDEIVLKRREASGVQLISSRNPLFGILKLIKRKGVMSILSDQKIGKRGTLASFFGRVTACSRLPLMIHDRVGAPVYTLGMESLQPGYWRIWLQRVENPTQQRIMDQLAASMQQSHSDCFWFQDRWQEFPLSDNLAQEDSIQSDLFSPQRLIGILESRAILEHYPNIRESLSTQSYNLTYWDEGADPSRAYFAIGDHPDFITDCKRVGLSKGIQSAHKCRL